MKLGMHLRTARMTKRRALFAAAAMMSLAAISAPSSGVGAAPTQKQVQTYQYYVFSNPVAGQEAEYNRWYNEQHVGDVLTAKDFVDARRYELSDQQLFVRADVPVMPRYLVVYRIKTDDIERTMAEVIERVQSGKTVSSPAYDRSTSQSMMYRETGDAFINANPVDPAPSAATAPVQDYLHFVFTAAVPGREADFDSWYVGKHLSEAGASPGFIASRRLELARPSRAMPAPTRYAATFEARTRDFNAVTQAYKAGSKQRSHTDSLERNLTRGYTYRAIGAVVTRDALLAKRAAQSDAR